MVKIPQKRRISYMELTNWRANQSILIVIIIQIYTASVSQVWKNQKREPIF